MAIPSDLGGRSSVDDEEVLFEAVVADMFSISPLLTKPEAIALPTWEDVCKKVVQLFYGN